MQTLSTVSETVHRSAPLRYAIAIAMTAAALALNFIPAIRPQAFFFFYDTVALTARCCGAARPALATVLSAILTAYFFLGAPFSWSFSGQDIIQLIGFVLVSVII